MRLASILFPLLNDADFFSLFSYLFCCTVQNSRDNNKQKLRRCMIWLLLLLLEEERREGERLGSRQRNKIRRQWARAMWTDWIEPNRIVAQNKQLFDCYAIIFCMKISHELHCSTFFRLSFLQSNRIELSRVECNWQSLLLSLSSTTTALLSNH